MRPTSISEVVDIDPDPVVVGAAPVTVSFGLALDAPEVEGRLTAPDGSVSVVEFDERPPPCNWRATHTFPPGTETGVWRIEVSGRRASVETLFAVENEAGRPRTRITQFDVQPREAVVGAPVVFTGELQVTHDGDRWDPLPGQTVVVAFRREGTCGFLPVVSARTDDRGAFRSRIAAEADGEFRAEFGSPEKDSPIVYLGSKSPPVAFKASANTEILGYGKPAKVLQNGRRKLRHKGRLHKKNTSFYPSDETITVTCSGVSGTGRTDDKGGFVIYTNRKSGKWTARFGGDSRAVLDPCSASPA